MSTGFLPDPGSDPLLARLEQLNKRRSVPTRFPPPPPPATTGALTGPPMTSGRPTLPASPSRQPNPPQRRRRGPAKVAKAGALVISCLGTGGLAALFSYLNEATAATESLAALPAPIAVTPASTSPTVANTPSTDAAAPAAVTPATDVATSVASEPPAAETTTSTAATAVGAVSAFNGDVVDTRFGPVQVQVQITDGALTEVAVIQYPDDDRKSVRINARALPTLRSEALVAQDADVDTVSGATYTSVAYAKSLQSAIDQARAASAIA